jgi:anaerobic selenocysteine-containing dehydrogenase
VLYLIGVQPPHSGAASVIYQNIDQPLDGQSADLLLPAAAFTEVDGTLVTFDGRVMPFHKAVAAPGMAQPSWQILCRIAQCMNVPGFDYASVDDVRAELVELIAGYQPGGRLSMDMLNAAFPAAEQPDQDVTTGEEGAEFVLTTSLTPHTHMGFSMARRVAGLQALFPEETVLINPVDATRVGIRQGDDVIVSSPYFERSWPVQLDDCQQPGTLSVTLSVRNSIGPMITPAEIRKTHVQTD